MDADFWRARWANKQIAFHEGAPNSFLSEHVDLLKPAKRVLVPLCGKTEDLAFLAAKGFEVVGIELVDDAVRAFFAEHGLTPEIEKHGALTSYRAGTVQVISGDFFAVTPALTGPVDAFYDRAALVALPPDLREKYIAHLKTFAKRGLLITLEYAPGVREGPPFSISPDEVQWHWPRSRLLQTRFNPQYGPQIPETLYAI
jgi:thiopurine S-methyltransferase